MGSGKILPDPNIYYRTRLFLVGCALVVLLQSAVREIVEQAHDCRCGKCQQKQNCDCFKAKSAHLQESGENQESKRGCRHHGNKDCHTEFGEGGTDAIQGHKADEGD